jgi:hypothetical protein
MLAPGNKLDRQSGISFGTAEDQELPTFLVIGIRPIAVDCDQRSTSGATAVRSRKLRVCVTIKRKVEHETLPLDQMNAVSFKNEMGTDCE